MTRREYLSTVGAVTGCITLDQPEIHAQPSPIANAVDLTVTINGSEQKFQLDPRVTLLDLLRDHLGLTGAKKGCDHGQCGACTVVANGRRINSCLSLAVTHHSGRIVTIEGLAQAEALHPMQAAFIEHDGLQCGYCTPGQICSAVAMLAEVRHGDASFVTDLRRKGGTELTAEEIRERMSGNICRCGAYPGIVAAVQAVAGTPGAGEADRAKGLGGR